jgi:hypothetical protein
MRSAAICPGAGLLLDSKTLLFSEPEEATHKRILADHRNRVARECAQSRPFAFQRARHQARMRTCEAARSRLRLPHRRVAHRRAQAGEESAGKEAKLCPGFEEDLPRSNARDDSRTRSSKTSEKSMKESFRIVLRLELLEALPVRGRKGFFGARRVVNYIGFP